MFKPDILKQINAEAPVSLEELKEFADSLPDHEKDFFWKFLRVMFDVYKDTMEASNETKNSDLDI